MNNYCEDFQNFCIYCGATDYISVIEVPEGSQGKTKASFARTHVENGEAENSTQALEDGVDEPHRQRQLAEDHGRK